jgi:diphthamide synthase (EF-2-diphthine--ammonia ligase)
MLERLTADPGIQVVGLLTTVSTPFDRVSMHGVRRSILRRQAEALELPLLEIPLGASPSNASYEEAFAAGLAQFRKACPHLVTVAFGDLFLEEVRRYREELLDRLGWKGLYPLWGEPTRALAQYFIARGYRAVLTCVDTTQLEARFAGREFDSQLLAELPTTVDPCGERGEFHTCVYEGPLLRDPITLCTGERVLRDGRFQYCDLLEPGAELPVLTA